MREDHLVSTGWLAEHLNDSNVRIVDMRGYVKAQPRGDGTYSTLRYGAREAYEASHIPGALFLDFARDIIDPDDPVPVQVAKPEQLARVLGQAGIGDEHLVIAYDASQAMSLATRLWWVFRYYGHRNVRVLDGGWNKWTHEGRSTTADVSHFPPATFTPNVQPQLRATAAEVLGLMGQGGIKLLDARDEGNYSGKIQRAKRPGHIPGALNLPAEVLVDPATGTFRSDEDLRRIMRAAAISPDQRVVAYCGGGIAATAVLFALDMLGYPALTNYDGSWSEWGEREDLPAAIGELP